MATSNSITPTKICTRCKREFPVTAEYWHRHKTARFGFNPRCKECCAIKYAERELLKGRVVHLNRAYDGEKRCSKCGEIYPATSEHFRPVKHHKDGFSSRCRICIRASERERQRKRRLDPEFRQHEHEYDKRYRSNPNVRERKSKYGALRYRDPIVNAHRKQYSHEYEQRDNRRLKRRVRSSATRLKRKAVPGFYTAEDIQLLLRTQKHKCWWCGKKLTGKYEVDHRIPVSRGGTNWPENLCIACFDCNRSKHAKLPHEFNGRLL